MFKKREAQCLPPTSPQPRPPPLIPEQIGFKFIFALNINISLIHVKTVLKHEGKIMFQFINSQFEKWRYYNETISEAFIF